MNLAASMGAQQCKVFFIFGWSTCASAMKKTTIHYDYFQSNCIHPNCIPLLPQFTFPTATVATQFFEQETIKFFREVLHT